MSNSDTKTDKKPKTKGKLSVSKFVAVMSGGAVVIDDGALGPRSKSVTSAARLEGLQGELQALGMPCPDIDAAIDTYARGLKEAMQESTSSVQDSLFAALAVQTRQAEAHFALVVAAAQKLSASRIELVAAIERKAQQVAAMPEGAVRTMMLGTVTAWPARLPQADQTATLADLAARQQTLLDIQGELTKLDEKAAAQQMQHYQDAVSELLLAFSATGKSLSALPAVPLRAALEASLETLEDQVMPLDRITGLGNLAGELQSLADIGVQLKTLTDEQVAGATAYKTLLDQAQQAYDQKTLRAAALPGDALRDAVNTALAAAAPQCVPMAQLTAADDLKAKLADVKAAQARLDAVNVEAIGKIAEEHERLLVRLPDIEDKARDIAAITAPTLQALLSQELDTIRAVFVPLEPRADASGLQSALQSQLDRLMVKSRLLDELDVPACHALLQSYDDLLAALPGEIDAMALRVASDLGKGAQAALRTEFMKELPSDMPTTLSSLRARIAKLEELRTSLAQRKVDKPSSAMKKELARADASLADARKLLDRQEPEARKASEDALKSLELAVGLLKIQGDPGALAKLDLPDGIVLGKSKGSGIENVPVLETERARAIDSAIKAVTLALKNPQSPEARLLKFDGGEAFAKGLCKMNTTLIASGANHKGLSPAEALAIHRYTGADYTPMNQQRRGGVQDERLAFLNATCDQALAKMPAYPDAAWPTFRIETAWSQDVVDNRYGEGKQFTCGILWSTGARGVAAINLRGSPTFTHIIYGKKGRDVAALSANPHEGGTEQGGLKASVKSGRGEVLFPASSNFLVAKRVDEPGTGPTPIPYSADAADARITTTLREVTKG